MIKVYQLRKKQNNFEIVLYYKGVGVKVVFNDGNTYKGIFPKAYISDPFRQRAVENSQMFKDKDIVIERQIEEESDRQHKQPQNQVAQPAKTAESEPATQPEQAPAAEPTVAEPAAEPAPEEQGDGMEKKEFANLADAITFVAQQYQVQVTTEAEARKVMKEHGINPTIKRG